MTMEISYNEIDDDELPDHTYDHIMGCETCFDQAADYIFTQFVKDGFAPNSSFLRQALKYFDRFCISKHDKLENEEEGEEHE
jgi:hypothetical protein